jgi:hypothetical protein
MAQQQTAGNSPQMAEVTRIVRAMREDRVPRSKISSTLNNLSVDSLLVIEKSGAHKTKPETQTKLASWLASYPQAERERWLAAAGRGTQAKSSGAKSSGATSAAKTTGAKSSSTPAAKKSGSAVSNGASGGAQRPAAKTAPLSASKGGVQAGKGGAQANKGATTVSKKDRGAGQSSRPAWAGRSNTSGNAGSSAGRQMVSARQAAKKTAGGARKRTAASEGASQGGGQVTILRENGQSIRLKAGQEYHMKGNASFYQMNEVR